MAKGVVKAMATKGSWGQVKHADDYLRGELKEQKEKEITKTSNELYDGLNCNRDNFTKTCMLYMKMHGEKEVKAYEYVQSFSPEDKKNGLTPEKAHDLGMEFSRKYFGEYPTLVVTHIDTDHIHNQIIVGNVNVDTGKSLQINPNTLEKMKQYTGKQCEREGLTYSTWEKKKERSPWEQKKNCEYLMESQGKVTDKQQIAYVVRQEIQNSNSLDDLKNRLHEKYQIEVRTTKNSISFSHPDMKRPIRGDKLGEDLTKGAIENGIEHSRSERGQGRIEQLKSDIDDILQYNRECDAAYEQLTKRANENARGRSTSSEEQSKGEFSWNDNNGEQNIGRYKTTRELRQEVYRNSLQGREDFRKKFAEYSKKYRGLEKGSLEGNEKLSILHGRRSEEQQAIDRLSTERDKVSAELERDVERKSKQQPKLPER